VCQSNDMKNDFIENLGFKREKLVVINNPVTSSFSLKIQQPDQSILKFVTIGRLVPQKGHLRILKALKDFNKPFLYTIIGDGKEKEKIMNFATKNRLQSKIKHISFTSEVDKYLADSHLFLSGSYVEGFPNVFLESCAVGTPVLAFKAPGGINEIIIDGINGYAVDSLADFKDRLVNFEVDKWNLEKVRESVTSRYSEKIILQRYEKLFIEVAKKN
ncbi:MAG: glycosyltransferase, partial [Maribacter sp.]